MTVNYLINCIGNRYNILKGYKRNSQLLKQSELAVARAAGCPCPTFLKCPSLLSVQCRVIKVLQATVG
jgi:hypothetical protein